jgi:hypothetical protein
MHMAQLCRHRHGRPDWIPTEGTTLNMAAPVAEVAGAVGVFRGRSILQ